MVLYFLHHSDSGNFEMQVTSVILEYLENSNHHINGLKEIEILNLFIQYTIFSCFNN